MTRAGSTTELDTHGQELPGGSVRASLRAVAGLLQATGSAITVR